MKGQDEEETFGRSLLSRGNPRITSRDLENQSQFTQSSAGEAGNRGTSKLFLAVRIPLP